MRCLQLHSHGTIREVTQENCWPSGATHSKAFAPGKLTSSSWFTSCRCARELAMAWGRPHRERQTSPEHRSSPSTQPFAGTAGTPAINPGHPPAPAFHSRTGPLEFGLSASLAANIPSSHRDGFTPAGPGGIRWG